MKREMPEVWRAFLEPHGIDSLRGLSRRTGVAPQTIVRLFRGSVSDATVTKVAEALSVNPHRIYELRDVAPREPFTLPASAAQLTEKQRRAVLAVVHSMLDPGPVAELTKRTGRGRASDYAPAAMEGESRGLQQRAESDRRGEESQDPDDAQ